MDRSACGGIRTGGRYGNTMFESLNRPLAAHKFYRGICAADVLLEWKEPAIIRQRLAASELKKLAKALPVLFPILALLGLALFAGKVVSKGHALSEIPWSGLAVVSLILGFVLCLRPLSDIALLRWDPAVVRLATGGVGKWCNRPDTPLGSDYSDIRTAFVRPHPLMPEVQTIVLTLRDGREAALALPDSIEPGYVLDILKAHGVLCIPKPATVTSRP